MTTRKQRHQIYLPDDLSAALDALGGKSGSSKSRVVAEALRAWLDRRAGHALDERFAVRLDRMGRGLEQVNERLAFVAEALGTFVQHQLTLVAHQPGFTPEAVHLGQQRYRAFLEAVGRRLAGGGDLVAAEGGDESAEKEWRMTTLKLGKLPDRAPVRVTVALAPDLHRALADYAALYRETYGQEESVAELIPFMLQNFLASDRCFARARRND
jgi:predicted transcriptional regulator